MSALCDSVLHSLASMSTSVRNTASKGSWRRGSEEEGVCRGGGGVRRRRGSVEEEVVVVVEEKEQ